MLLWDCHVSWSVINSGTISFLKICPKLNITCIIFGTRHTTWSFCATFSIWTTSKNNHVSLHNSSSSQGLQVALVTILHLHTQAFQTTEMMTFELRGSRSGWYQAPRFGDMNTQQLCAQQTWFSFWCSGCEERMGEPLLPSWQPAKPSHFL